MNDDDATRRLLQDGKLEKMCRACGRWEAASPRCSWCYAPVPASDWYRNGDAAERAARLPVTAPANPPTEYRSSADWPATWGPNPHHKPASPARAPIGALAGGQPALRAPEAQPRRRQRIAAGAAA